MESVPSYLNWLSTLPSIAKALLSLTFGAFFLFVIYVMWWGKQPVKIHEAAPSQKLAVPSSNVVSVDGNGNGTAVGNNDKVEVESSKKLNGQKEKK